ncbi:MAG: GNAT family N-acetyltransferase [Anaerolineae bacterium]|nr:GNAT family N-acetyltransferase [Anaerolineae bacterium]
MIQEHSLFLRGPRVVLRPFRELDLPFALVWYQDKEVLRLCEGSGIVARSVGDIRPIYEYLSQHGYLFIIEVTGEVIGEVCLERMNLPWVRDLYPGERIYRLPIMIGDRRYWGQGYGTETVELLLAFGFERLEADRFYIPGVWGFNQRALRLWRRLGFREVTSRPVILDRWGRIDETDEIDFTLTREEWMARRHGSKAGDE